jgi:hypothetical protein
MRERDWGGREKQGWMIVWEVIVLGKSRDGRGEMQPVNKSWKVINDQTRCANPCTRHAHVSNSACRTCTSWTKLTFRSELMSRTDIPLWTHEQNWLSIIVNIWVELTFNSELMSKTDIPLWTHEQNWLSLVPKLMRKTDFQLWAHEQDWLSIVNSWTWLYNNRYVFRHASLNVNSSSISSHNIITTLKLKPPGQLTNMKISTVRLF